MHRGGGWLNKKGLVVDGGVGGGWIVGGKFFLVTTLLYVNACDVSNKPHEISRQTEKVRP